MARRATAEPGVVRHTLFRMAILTGHPVIRAGVSPGEREVSGEGYPRSSTLDAHLCTLLLLERFARVLLHPPYHIIERRVFGVGRP